MSKREFLSIKTLVFGLLTGVIGFVAAYYVFGEAEKQPDPQSEFFPVYGIDPQTRNFMEPDKLYYVEIPNSVPLLYKMQMLADNISSFHFGRRPITVMEIENRNNKKIAIIDLSDFESHTDEYPTWHDIFEEFVGGQVTLRKSFLQEDYSGEWIDGVGFLYNGQPLTDELDNVFLSGTFMR